MRGILSVGELGGTVEYHSTPMESEAAARLWIQDGRQHAGLYDMPEPRVIRRSGHGRAR